jgi:uncharacterized protein YecE (DUF72 family)
LRLRAGTSGYSYEPWRGRFYPPDLKDTGMLRFYASRLPAVEVNNTFYRMPTEALVTRWAAETPADFVFALKAPQRITHQKRLRGAGEALERLFGAAAALGPRLGPVLFQLPPSFRKDLDRLRDFLAALPRGRRVSLEFRHESWWEEDVLLALREAGAALCVADLEEAGRSAPLAATADWGYLRLRRADYDDAALHAWARRVRGQAWTEAFAFFKHEDEGKAPALAVRFAEIFDALPP